MPTQKVSDTEQLLPHQWMRPDLRKVSWAYAYEVTTTFHDHDR